MSQDKNAEYPVYFLALELFVFVLPLIYCQLNTCDGKSLYELERFAIPIKIRSDSNFLLCMGHLITYSSDFPSQRCRAEYNVMVIFGYVVTLIFGYMFQSKVKDRNIAESNTYVHILGAECITLVNIVITHHSLYIPICRYIHINIYIYPLYTYFLLDSVMSEQMYFI